MIIVMYHSNYEICAPAKSPLPKGF